MAWCWAGRGRPADGLGGGDRGGAGERSCVRGRAAVLSAAAVDLCGECGAAFAGRGGAFAGAAGADADAGSGVRDAGAVGGAALGRGKGICRVCGGGAVRGGPDSVCGRRCGGRCRRRFRWRRERRSDARDR